MNGRPGSHAVSSRSSALLAAFRVKLLCVWTAAMYALYSLRRLLVQDPLARRALAPAWVQIWARTVCRIAGWRVFWRGPLPPRGALLCPNHLGYADILAVAAVAECFFVSRADAASWPFVGRLLRASEQVLVSRRRNRDLASTSEQIQSRLADGLSVCVFLEGTSTGGDRILPFLPALLQPAIEQGAPVVPTALRWTSARPEVSVSEDVAYWKDHRFVPHIFRLMGLRGVRVEVVFGAPLAPLENRKDLAERVRSEVVRLWEGEPWRQPESRTPK